jgi:hypothetical protein
MNMYLRKTLHPISTPFGCLENFYIPKIGKKNKVFQVLDFGVKKSNLKISPKIHLSNFLLMYHFSILSPHPFHFSTFSPLSLPLLHLLLSSSSTFSSPPLLS